MLHYNRIDVSEGTNINKTDESQKCIACNFYFFLKVTFRFKPRRCDCCHNLIKNTIIFNDIAIFSVKRKVYK